MGKPTMKSIDTLPMAKLELGRIRVKLEWFAEVGEKDDWFLSDGFL